jgi:hypothetical protein
MAAGAVSLGSRFGTVFEGERPEGAPNPEVSDAINDAADVNPEGFEIRRTYNGGVVYSG